MPVDWETAATGSSKEPHMKTDKEIEGLVRDASRHHDEGLEDLRRRVRLPDAEAAGNVRDIAGTNEFDTS